MTPQTPTGISNLTAEGVQHALFTDSYRNCRAIRDVVAFADGDISEVAWYPNSILSFDMTNRINSEELREEVERWRGIFRATWTDMNENDRVVSATDPVDSRPIEELAEIHMTTITMIRALERGIYRRILAISHP